MSSKVYSGRRMLWMPLGSPYAKPSAEVAICCHTMGDALDFDCKDHEAPFDCPDGLIVYNEVFDEYGVVVHDGGWSYVLITHCPWCGARLPDSARDRWFEQIEGLQSSDDEPPPPEYLTGAWRRER